CAGGGRSLASPPRTGGTSPPRRSRRRTPRLTSSSAGGSGHERGRDPSAGEAGAAGVRAPGPRPRAVARALNRGLRAGRLLVGRSGGRPGGHVRRKVLPPSQGRVGRPAVPPGG